MNENLKLFRVYDTKAKKYLLTSNKPIIADFNTKQKAKRLRNDNEYALPHLKNCEGAALPPQYIIQQDKYYKYRFQIRRAIDHRKGEN